MCIVGCCGVRVCVVGVRGKGYGVVMCMGRVAM